MNRPIKDTFLPIRLPSAQAQAVKSLAAASNTTASEIVRKAITVLIGAQVSQPTPNHEL